MTTVDNATGDSDQAMIAGRGSLQVTSPGQLTQLGWKPPSDDIGQGEWLTLGRQMVVVMEGLTWAIGDWWAYGAQRNYGEGNAIAAALGIPVQTIKNAASLARSFELSRRRDNLSAAHHAEVTRRDDADEWLDRAELGDVDPTTGEATRWSRNKLRSEIKAHDKALRDADRAAQAGGSAVMRCCTAEELLADIDDGSVDLLLTDPPYDTDVDDITTFVAWVQQALPKLKPTGRAVIFHGRYPAEIAAYLQQAAISGLDHEVCVWHYPDTLGPNPKGRFKTTHQMAIVLHGPDAPDLYTDSLVDKQSCWAVAMNQEAVRYFSWQKPQALAEKLVAACAPPDGLVVDCFAGAGTFLVAAAALGRSAIGCDPDPDRMQDAEQRGIEVVQ
jgi:hypothetical protein